MCRACGNSSWHYPAKFDPQYCTELTLSLTRMLLVLPECSAPLTSAEKGCVVYKLAGKTVIQWSGFSPNFPIVCEGTVLQFCNVPFVHQRQAYRAGYRYSFLTGGLVGLMLQQITMLGCAQVFLLRKRRDLRAKSRMNGVIFMHRYL